MILNFLFEFRTFIADGFHGALRYFDHVLETDGLNRAIYFFRGGVVLSENGRSDDEAGSFTGTLPGVSSQACAAKAGSVPVGLFHLGQRETLVIRSDRKL